MEQDFACGVCSCIFDFDAHAAYNHTGCVFKIGKKCLDELLEKSNNC